MLKIILQESLVLQAVPSGKGTSWEMGRSIKTSGKYHQYLDGI
jgi:hypothetical protein